MESIHILTLMLSILLHINLFIYKLQWKACLVLMGHCWVMIRFVLLNFGDSVHKHSKTWSCLQLIWDNFSAFELRRLHSKHRTSSWWSGLIFLWTLNERCILECISMCMRAPEWGIHEAWFVCLNNTVVWRGYPSHLGHVLFGWTWLVVKNQPNVFSLL